MAKIPKAEFKLFTEEEMEVLLEEKPELLSHTFEGYCIQTGDRLLFGPQATEADQCIRCFPNSHFFMVPLKYLDPEPPVERPVLRSIASIRAEYQKIKG